MPSFENTKILPFSDKQLYEIIINVESYQKKIKKLKKELYTLKSQFGNNMSADELRDITKTDFGGLESKKWNFKSYI